jgi:hypothetical protein
VESADIGDVDAEGSARDPPSLDRDQCGRPDASFGRVEAFVVAPFDPHLEEAFPEGAKSGGQRVAAVDEPAPVGGGGRVDVMGDSSEAEVRGGSRGPAEGNGGGTVDAGLGGVQVANGQADRGRVAADAQAPGQPRVGFVQQHGRVWVLAGRANEVEADARTQAERKRPCQAERMPSGRCRDVFARPNPGPSQLSARHEADVRRVEGESVAVVGRGGGPGLRLCSRGSDGDGEHGDEREEARGSRTCVHGTVLGTWLGAGGVR